MIARKTPLLLEALINQSQDMACFSEESVNCLRIITFNTRDGIKMPFGFLKSGRKGSFVDNAANGGVFAIVDMERGITCTEGCDESGGRYTFHPDSGIRMKGFVLPDFEQAKQLCSKAALLTPRLQFLGWDLAHTGDRGWIIVETNTSPLFLQQAGTLVSVRTELRALMESMDLLTSYKL